MSLVANVAGAAQGGLRTRFEGRRRQMRKRRRSGVPTYTCSSHGLPGMVTFPCAICGRTQTQHDVCMDSDLQSNIIRLGSRPGVPPLPHAGAHAGGAAEGQSHQRAARQRGKLHHIPTPVEGLRTSPRLGRDVLGPLRAAPQAALQADGTLVSAKELGATRTLPARYLRSRCQGNRLAWMRCHGPRSTEDCGPGRR